MRKGMMHRVWSGLKQPQRSGVNDQSITTGRRELLADDVIPHLQQHALCPIQTYLGH